MMAHHRIYLCETPHFAQKKKSSKKPAIRAGLKFEKQIQEQLKWEFPHSYANHFIAEVTYNGTRYHSPDWFGFTGKDTLHIVECKLTHDRHSTEQLFRYHRLLAYIYPNYRIYLTEVFSRTTSRVPLGTHLLDGRQSPKMNFLLANPDGKINIYTPNDLPPVPDLPHPFTTMDDF